MPLATLQCVGLNEIITCDAKLVADLKEYAVSLGWGHDGAIAKISNEQRIGQRLSARVERKATYVFVPAVNLDHQRAAQHPPDHQVLRLFAGAECCGTATAFRKDVLTAAHVVLDNKALLPNLSASLPNERRRQLVFVAAHLPLDIALLQWGSYEPRPAGLELAQAERVHTGATVRLMSYPKGAEDTRPMGCQVASGKVTGQVDTLTKAFASYSGAMPNSSGGAVISEDGKLLGIHCGQVYHMDKQFSPLGPAEDVDDDDNGPAIIWADDAELSQAATLPSIEDDRSGDHSSDSSTASVRVLSAQLAKVKPGVQHASANIEHKTSLSYFATSAGISQFLEAIDKRRTRKRVRR